MSHQAPTLVPCPVCGAGYTAPNPETAEAWQGYLANICYCQFDINRLRMALAGDTTAAQLLRQERARAWNDRRKRLGLDGGERAVFAQPSLPLRPQERTRLQCAIAYLEKEGLE